jgi:hypothetical protein
MSPLNAIRTVRGPPGVVVVVVVIVVEVVVVVWAGLALVGVVVAGVDVDVVDVEVEDVAGVVVAGVDADVVVAARCVAAGPPEATDEQALSPTTRSHATRIEPASQVATARRGCGDGGR